MTRNNTLMLQDTNASITIIDTKAAPVENMAYDTTAVPFIVDILKGEIIGGIYPESRFDIPDDLANDNSLRVQEVSITVAGSNNEEYFHALNFDTLRISGKSIIDLSINCSIPNVFVGSNVILNLSYNIKPVDGIETKHIPGTIAPEALTGTFMILEDAKFNLFSNTGFDIKVDSIFGLFNLATITNYLNEKIINSLISLADPSNDIDNISPANFRKITPVSKDLLTNVILGQFGNEAKYSVAAYSPFYRKIAEKKATAIELKFSQNFFKYHGVVNSIEGSSFEVISDLLPNVISYLSSEDIGINVELTNTNLSGAEEYQHCSYCGF